MNVTINEDCIGCGTCENVCGDVFEVNDSGVAVVKDGVDASAFEDGVKEAADACPVSAIEVA